MGTQSLEFKLHCEYRRTPPRAHYSHYCQKQFDESSGIIRLDDGIAVECMGEQHHVCFSPPNSRAKTHGVP